MGKTIAEYFATEIIVPMVKDINKDNPGLNKVATEQLTILKDQITEYKIKNKVETIHDPNKGVVVRKVMPGVKCKICPPRNPHIPPLQ